jgi:hypothetical protein
MRIYKKPNDESKFALLKCEHCGHMEEHDGKIKVEDVCCAKCRMHTERGD